MRGVPAYDLTKDFLYREYVINEKSQYDIAKETGYTPAAICMRLKKYNIPARKKPTKQQREKISKSLKGRTGSMKGKHLSEETKNKLRISHLGKYKNPTEFGGHKKLRADGYVTVYVPEHPNATKDGYVMEHILVMEKHIGRIITRDEVVHHKNKIRNDNRIENLQLMTFKEHAGFHMKERHEQRRNKLCQ